MSEESETMFSIHMNCSELIISMQLHEAGLLESPGPDSNTLWDQ